VVVSTTQIPSGPPQTGGGLSGGTDVPLAAGGAATLAAGAFGLVGVRRWQRGRAR
jgi:hypothetical protein